MTYHIEPIPRSLMAAFVAAHHYAVRVPAHCLLSLGCFYGWRGEAGHEFLGPNNATDAWSIKKVPLRRGGRAAVLPRGQPRKEDNSTLRKPDIITLRRQLLLSA